MVAGSVAQLSEGGLQRCGERVFRTSGAREKGEDLQEVPVRIMPKPRMRMGTVRLAPRRSIWFSLERPGKRSRAVAMFGNIIAEGNR